MRLTTKAIKAFKHSDGWDVRWDDAVPGLGVRVYPSGKRSVVLSYRVGGCKGDVPPNVEKCEIGVVWLMMLCCLHRWSSMTHCRL